jgi:hypothetical protein
MFVDYFGLSFVTTHYYIVTYVSGARQRSLGKQQFCQPLLGNNCVNNGHCLVITTTVRFAIMEGKEERCFLAVRTARL